MQAFRKLLWPFSLVYGFITFVRNKWYDWGIFKSFAIPGKSICVGNLSVGGTGKTPHVAYLAEFLKDQSETSILSRGYGRKTSGFRLVNTSDSAENVGDEPLFYSSIFDKNVHVAVCEKRAEGVQALQQLFPSNQLIILDDAYLGQRQLQLIVRAIQTEREGGARQRSIRELEAHTDLLPVKPNQLRDLDRGQRG